MSHIGKKALPTPPLNTDSSVANVRARPLARPRTHLHASARESGAPARACWRVGRPAAGLPCRGPQRAPKGPPACRARRRRPRKLSAPPTSLRKARHAGRGQGARWRCVYRHFWRACKWPRDAQSRSMLASSTSLAEPTSGTRGFRLRARRSHRHRLAAVDGHLERLAEKMMLAEHRLAVRDGERGMSPHRLAREDGHKQGCEKAWACRAPDAPVP